MEATLFPNADPCDASTVFRAFWIVDTGGYQVKRAKQKKEDHRQESAGTHPWQGTGSERVTKNKGKMSTRDKTHWASACVEFEAVQGECRDRVKCQVTGDNITEMSMFL